MECHKGFAHCSAEGLFTISGKLDGEMVENLSQSYLEQVASREKLIGKWSNAQRIHVENIYLHFPFECGHFFS